MMKAKFKKGDWVTIDNTNTCKGEVRDLYGKIGTTYQLHETLITEPEQVCICVCTDETYVENQGSWWYQKNLRKATHQEVLVALLRIVGSYDKYNLVTQAKIKNVTTKKI